MPHKAVSLIQQLAQQSRIGLIEDDEFGSAVSSANLEAASACAVDVVLDILQQHFPLHTSTVPPAGRTPDASTMLAMINIGDQVTRKPRGAHEGAANKGPADVTGAVIEVSQCQTDKPPVYTVRWKDQPQSKEAFDNLVLVSKRSQPFDCLTTPMQLLDSKGQASVLSDLRTSLLEVEDRLPWTCVTRGFAATRSSWRKDLLHATTLRQFLRSYKDFIPFLKIEQHMPATTIQCNAAATLAAMHGCAERQDFAGMHDLWMERVMPDFTLWQTAANGKQRPSHIHTGRAMQVMESAFDDDQPSSLSEVPWGAILTQEQLAALKVNMRRELDFLDRKARDLKAATKRDAPLSDSLLSGVTYDRSGLGGSYGGMPRARQSMLDGVWDYRSDVDTQLDTGSEATDLLDSCLCGGGAAAGEGGEGDVSSRCAVVSSPAAHKRPPSGARDDAPAAKVAKRVASPVDLQDTTDTSAQEG